MKPIFSSIAGARPKKLIATYFAGALICSTLPAAGASQPAFQVNPNAGTGDVIVRGKLGGFIFGFEIDPNGTEGLLCEAALNSDGTVMAAIETFDQATGRIVRILGKTNTEDDFIALTVAGSVGLIEREKVRGLFNSSSSKRKKRLELQKRQGSAKTALLSLVGRDTSNRDG
ncbi:MAG: hypothetical protein M3Q86_05785 [Verrucomicrobiota bacterium]|nr:hypothetical protein [Verrucomicrobiota bacterium]